MCLHQRTHIKLVYHKIRLNLRIHINSRNHQCKKGLYLISMYRPNSLGNVERLCAQIFCDIIWYIQVNFPLNIKNPRALCFLNHKAYPMAGNLIQSLSIYMTWKMLIPKSGSVYRKTHKGVVVHSK